MDIEIATICDAATINDGKMNILGAFDTIYVQSLPAIHNSCSIAFRIRIPMTKKHPQELTLKIVDPNDQEIYPPIVFNIKEDLNKKKEPSILNLVYNINGLSLNKYGTYQAGLFTKDKKIRLLPLFVKKLDGSNNN